VEVTPDDPLLGTLVADRYRVVRKLGEGGMGVVYQAVHEALRKPVAIKLLAPAGRIDKEAIARFEREAIAAANLRHTNIAEATDFGRLPDGALYLVMEYVEGTTLRRLLREHGKLAPERALGILQQVAAALATAHARDVVHRDLKPENVIVVSVPGAADVVKVIDFGIAKIRNATFGAGSAALTKAGTVFGTPEYMAPEQVMGQAADARADQYALGVLAFELFTGKPPFAADDMGQLMMMHVGAPIPSSRERTPALPAAADAVLTKMLGKLPEERFASVGEAISELVAAFASSPAPVVSTSISGVALPSGTFARGASLPGATLRLDASQSGSHVAQAVPPQTLRSIAIEPPRGNPTAAGPIAPRQITPRPPLFALVIGVASLLAGVMLAVLIAHSYRGDSSAPSQVAGALADWNGGKLDPAAAALRSALTADPKLAGDVVIARTLAASVGDEAGRRALAGLLATTALGRSTAMASALAAVAVQDEPRARDGALELLRERQDLLSKEQGARVRLRDSDDCETLQDATTEETEVATTDTLRDVERLRSPECKTLLRVVELCEECKGSGGSPGKGIGAGPGGKKGKGKKDKHRGRDD
jgi:serine/threonine protein kinase